MKKNYVCSDVHAHAGVLKKALDTLDADDRLFMIGDAVDKGPDGMRALQILMDDPRCEMLIGNHDLMFLQHCICQQNADILPQDIVNDVAVRWLIRNYGIVTWEAFLEESEEEQQRIITYLQHRPVLKIVETENRKFILVHAAVPRDFDPAQLKDMDMDVLRDPVYPFLYDWKSDFIWGRYPTHIEGCTTVVGHTACQHFGGEYVQSEGDDWMDIDCGLAYNEPSSKLALLCLDDMSVQYFLPDGE